MFSSRLHQSIAAAGLGGVVLLGAYFGIPIPQPPGNATSAQIADFVAHYGNFLYFGGWLQITGTLLAAIFFIGLVYLAGATTRLSGLLTLFGAAVLLGTSLIEAALIIEVAQATANGHPETAVGSWDLQSVFIHVFPIGPAPLIFLAVGSLILATSLLPRVLGYVALGLGIAFEVVGVVGLFVPAAKSVVIVLLIGQEIWIAAAAIMLLRPKAPRVAAA